jgi:two-component system sensor histidine kinase MtrB
MRRRRMRSTAEPQGRRRLLRLGLRARITLSFAFGALVLSSALASITYFTARRQILSQEATSLQRQAFANAEQLYSDVNTNGLSPAAALAEIDNATSPSASSTSALTTASFSLLYLPTSSTTPYEENPEVGPRFWPKSLLSMAMQGTPATQFAAFHGTAHYFVGVPIPSMDAVFFETFALDQTSRTLQIIFAALVAAGIVTTLAGAILGRWVAGRALRPLRDVSQAALAIANGHLDTRLEAADVRDLYLLATSFNRMVDQLQQRIERDARFTSDVSHELRSPLTTLAASLSVIEARRDELPERSRQALDLVAAEVRRFQRMVGELLEISRFDAGSADFEASTLRVGELVRRAVSASGTSEVPVEVDPAVEDRLVVVDKRRLERVMTNLLENAEHYAGGATRVLVDANGAFVRIAVEDDGPGIPVQERERIFERFARGGAVAGRRGASQGTGLGLALVSEHIKLHRGRVWVEDSRSGGARFVVELPLVTPDEDAAEPQPDNDASPLRAGGLQGIPGEETSSPQPVGAQAVAIKAPGRALNRLRRAERADAP